MTLCIAWKNEQGVYFASDSRLCAPDGTTITNDATKIFKINIGIYGATPEGETITPLVHQTTFGFCFAGSYINGSILADTIDEILSEFQVSPFSDYSFDNLSNIAFAIYKRYSKQLCEINRDAGLAEVMFGGFCPVTELLKLCKFSAFIDPEHGLSFDKQQILLNQSVEFLGDHSAKEKALEFTSKLNGRYTYFHLLKEVIKTESVSSVGGNIQTGHFSSGRFKTNGIIEYSVQESEHGHLQVKTEFQFRGLSLNFDDNDLRSGNINIKKSFFDPFKDEKNECFRQVQKSIEERWK